jgi:hypothetical protein
MQPLYLSPDKFPHFLIISRSLRSVPPFRQLTPCVAQYDLQEKIPSHIRSDKRVVAPTVGRSLYVLESNL